MDDFLLLVLEKFKKSSPIAIDQLSCVFDKTVDDCADVVLHLRKLGYLKIEQNYANLHGMSQESLIGYQTPLVITLEGKMAITQEKRSRRKLLFDGIRAWATLAIAFAALLVSLFAVAQG